MPVSSKPKRKLTKRRKQPLNPLRQQNTSTHKELEMRKVASYSASANTSSESFEEFNETLSEIERWIESKGDTSKNPDQSGTITYPNGKHAEFSKENIISSIGQFTEYELTEPTESGLFQTVIRIGKKGTKLSLYTELRVGSTANTLTPLYFDARCPSIIRNIINLEIDWHVGQVPLTTKPLDFQGIDGAKSLMQIIWHPERTLPVVVVSKYEGATLTPQVAENIAADLSGLAIVAIADEETSWFITETKGREWSCFNGGVRLYWPLIETSSEHRIHPLWTRSSLLRGILEPKDASYRLRKLLRKKILSSSAFSMREDQIIQEIRLEHRKELYQARKNSAQSDFDWKELADSYAEDNQELASRLAESEKEKEILQAQVANLQEALKWKNTNEDEIEAAIEIPPATIREAVERAQDRYAEHLIFGDDVWKGIDTLAMDAGPPEKVLLYFDGLAKLVTERRKGPLGKTAIQWLKNQGLNCSCESERVRNGKATAQARTWHDGNKRRVFEDHLKPNDATSAERCVRIYFDNDENSDLIVIGWVGRHPED